MRDTLLILAAFVLALSVRAVFVIEWQALPYGSSPLLDAQAYDQWASSIAQGAWLRARAFYQSPLYPYLLGLFYALWGHSFWIAGIFGALLDAATVALLTRFALRAFGPLAAAATALLGAFYRPMIFYAAPVMKEPLALFLLALLLPFAFRAWQENKRRDYALSGLLIGLGALTRGNLLLMAPALMILSFMRWRKEAWRNQAILALATFLAIAPATLHNAVASRDFVLMNYADGFNFYIGHSPVANGANAYPPEVSTDPVQEEINVSWIAKKETGRELKPSEVSRYWRGRAVDQILANPWREAALLKNKLAVFWNSAEKFDNYDIPFIAKNFDTILSWPLIGFWIPASLAAFGSVALWREKNRAALFLLALLGVYLLSVLPFYVTDRYRLPAVIFLLPLAGAGVSRAFQLARERSFPLFFCAGMAALGFAFLGLREDPTKTDLTAYDWGTLTTLYADQNRDREALKALAQGIAADPVELGPQAYIQAALAAQRLGETQTEKQAFAQALALYPQSSVVHYNMGRDQAAKGQLTEAQASLEKALELNPSYPLSYYGLALIHERKGDLARARIYIQKGLEADPSDANLQAWLKNRR